MKLNDDLEYIKSMFNHLVCKVQRLHDRSHDMQLTSDFPLLLLHSYVQDL